MSEQQYEVRKDGVVVFTGSDFQTYKYVLDHQPKLSTTTNHTEQSRLLTTWSQPHCSGVRKSVTRSYYSAIFRGTMKAIAIEMIKQKRPTWEIINHLQRIQIYAGLRPSSASTLIQYIEKK